MQYPSKFEFDIFREMHYKELDRKDTINTQVFLHIGIFSVLASGVFYYFSKLPPLELKSEPIIAALIALRLLYPFTGFYLLFNKGLLWDKICKP